MALTNLKVPVDYNLHLQRTSKAEIFSNQCIKLSQNGKILYLTVQEQNNHPFTLKTWPASTDNKYDEANPGVTMVGFEAQMSAKDTRVFTTTFAKEPKNIN